jgi:cytochrome c oxidase assembly factor CtaG
MLAPVPVVAHVAPAVEPLQLLAPTVAGALYALRVRALARQGRAVPPWRVACFAAGVLLGVVGLAALGHLGEERFSAHMAEHLLLGDVGALLIVLGLTGPVLAPALRLRGLRWLRALAHPVPALTLWALNLFAWHLACCTRPRSSTRRCMPSSMRCSSRSA